jgi:hypothetical protein
VPFWAEIALLVFHRQDQLRRGTPTLISNMPKSSWSASTPDALP